LKNFREQWKREENWDLVEKADAKIKELEAEEGQKTAQLTKVQTWHQAERELSANDPDFLKAGTRLDTRLRQIMGSADGDIYRQHERGIVAAYHRAKMELLQEDYAKLEKEHQALQQEHQRVTGLTSISGGTPGRIGNGQKDFASLSTAEMRKRLQSGVNRMPWI
jgi:phage terminase large subunit-like protein